MRLDITSEEREFLEKLVDRERHGFWAMRSLDAEKYEKEYMATWLLQKKLRQLDPNFISDQIFADNNPDHV